MKKMLVLAVAAFIFAGCATERLNIQHPGAITHKKIVEIKKGTSTKEEIKKIFGRPLDSLAFKKGETWFYKDFNLHSLYIEFDDNGIVTDYKYD